jgi:PRC-barrel domain
LGSRRHSPQLPRALNASPGAERTTAEPGETGRLRRTHEAWRSIRIVGLSVYNDHDERIGSVDDLLVGQDGKISEAVLSVGGFLGLGAKLVAVPYSELRFEEHSDDWTTTAGPTGNVTAPPAAPVSTPAAPAGLGVPAAPPARPVTTTRLVLPGATRESLRAQAEFRYRD